MAADAAKSAEYSEVMKAKMGSTLVYRHEDGINYAKPLHRIVVGSCLQGPGDADTLKKEGVGIVFCLQEDKDLAHFAIDIEAIERRCKELGISHVKSPVKDFDPLSLRRHLPDAVRRLNAEMEARPDELAYIHCTAGLGRAPGTALAYMCWIVGLELDEAYAQLFELRRCHPQLGMIRAATCDLLSGGEGSKVPTKITINRRGASVVEIAGLDVGWGNRLKLVKNDATGDFVLEHAIPPGTYQYKFIVDGNWEPSMDLPTIDDNGNINNVCEVSPEPGTADAERRARIMAPKGRCTDEELEQLRALLRAPAA